MAGAAVGGHGKYSLNQNLRFLFDGKRPCYYHCSELLGVKKVNNHHFFTDPQIFPASSSKCSSSLLVGGGRVDHVTRLERVLTNEFNDPIRLGMREVVPL